VREGALSCLLFDLGKLSPAGSPCPAVIFETSKVRDVQACRDRAGSQNVLESVGSFEAFLETYVSEMFSNILQTFPKVLGFFLMNLFHQVFCLGKGWYPWW